MQVKKLGIGLNFIEIRVGPMFVLRIQEHLNQVTQDLWPPLLWLKYCQNSNCLTKTAHVISKWPEKIKVWLLGLYLGSDIGKRTNLGAKTPNLRFLGLNFSKLSLTLSTLWANFQVQGVDLQLYPGSQQSRTEGKFGEKLRKSCKNVNWNELEFRMTVIIKRKLHSLCTFCEHSKAQKCTVC